MNFLKYYYQKIIKYDFINKFPTNGDLNSIPKLTQIILNFGCMNSEVTKLLATSLFLELITSKNVKITSSKKANIVIKIKKGYPTGCKITLKEKLMYQFLYKLLTEIFPKIKNFKQLSINSKKHKKSISYSIEEILLIFSELKEHYHIFSNKIPKLDIAIITNTKSQKEFIYLLKSFKIPIKQ
jgi:large subunit ribosomal protein L5